MVAKITKFSILFGRPGISPHHPTPCRRAFQPNFALLYKRKISRFPNASAHKWLPIPAASSVGLQIPQHLKLEYALRIYAISTIVTSALFTIIRKKLFRLPVERNVYRVDLGTVI